MQIAGGVYRELCEAPSWDAEFGSGGRAAAAVSALSPLSTLHTYAHDPHSRGIRTLQQQGIEVRAHAAVHAVAFSYFHPLSRPHIAPALHEVVQNQPLCVNGDTVIRFGFVEGDAVVDGSRVVYDPQTQQRAAVFAANGSRADQLALVLNEQEMRLLGSSNDLDLAARHIFSTQNAAVIVAKRGPRGAAVFECGGMRHAVPAYRSAHVFKIGTGDVFTAVFAHHWGERRIPAADAANLASRAVAVYCTNRSLPPDYKTAPGFSPVSTLPPGRLLLVGSVESLGRRWIMEEARFRINELGAAVAAPELDGEEVNERDVAAVLVLADGMSGGSLSRVANAHSIGLPIVVLAETAMGRELVGLCGSDATVTDDFVSGLYFAVWAAMASRGRRSPLPARHSSTDS